MPGRPLQARRLFQGTGRTIQASLRYLRLVASEFTFTFLLIFALLVVGALLFHRCQFSDLGGRSPTWTQSVFAAYALFAFQLNYPLPDSAPLRVVYFLYPLIGLALVADAVVRVTLLLFSRQENQKEWTKVLASTYRDHVVLCGLGRVGIRILERLREFHIDVVVIEKDERSAFLLKAQRLKVPVLMMDAKQEESLEQAGLEHARALIIATNDDLANVEIALDARRLKPGIRVVLRMFDEGIADKLREAFQLDVAFSSAASAAPMVAASVLDMDILGSFSLEGREYFTVRLRIQESSPLVDRPLGALGQKPEARKAHEAHASERASEYPVILVSRKQHGQALRLSPAPDERVQAGDELVVQGELDELRRLNQLARQGASRSKSKPRLT